MDVSRIDTLPELAEIVEKMRVLLMGHDRMISEYRDCIVDLQIGSSRLEQEVVSPGPKERPACGHSVCRQHWVEAGDSDCVDGEASP